MRNTILSSVAVIALASAGQAATLVNGSMDGAVGSSNTPTGWISTNSVDITSTATQPFAFIVNPGDSDDGGTWAGLASDTSTYTEAVSQTVTDFTVGQNYTLTWFGVNTGCCGGAYNATNTLYFNLDGVNEYTSAALAVDGQWHTLTHSFTATSTSHSLTFGVTSGVRSYMGIDGITLAETVSAVPLPAAGGFLLAALGGLTVAGRKRKKS